MKFEAELYNSGFRNIVTKTEIAKLMKVLSLFNVLKNDCCFKCLSDYIGLWLKCITENVKYSF